MKKTATLVATAGPQKLSARYERRYMTETGRNVGQNMTEYRFSTNRSVMQELEFEALPGRTYQLVSQACSDGDADRSLEVHEASDGKVVGAPAITCADLQAVRKLDREADAYLKANSRFDRSTVLLNWREDCLTCHGAYGKADTRRGRALQAPDFSSKEWQAATTDAAISKAVMAKNGPNHVWGGALTLDVVPTWILLVRWLGGHAEVTAH